MIRERGEPAIADTSKPIIEPPVFPDYPENTQTTRPVAEDPDLVGNDDEDDAEEEDDDDLDDEDIDEEVSDEADEDFTDVKEPAVFKDEEFFEDEDEDDEF